MKNQSDETPAVEPFPFRLLYAGWGIAKSAPCRWAHSNYEYVTVEYVVEGRGILESDGFRFECSPGSVYFLHRHSTHSYWTVPEAPWHKLFFTVDGKLVDTLLESYGLTREYHLAGVPQLRHNFEALTELGFPGNTRADWKAAAIFHQFTEACAEILLERSQSAPSEVMELKEALDRNVNGKSRLETFCREIGCSQTHMIQRFKEAFGCTPGEYRMRQRIEAARRLLDFSRKSVKEIAAELEFSDQYYFSNCFKARTGMSPSQYRKRT